MREKAKQLYVQSCAESSTNGIYTIAACYTFSSAALKTSVDVVNRLMDQMIILPSRKSQNAY